MQRMTWLTMLALLLALLLVVVPACGDDDDDDDNDDNDDDAVDDDDDDDDTAADDDDTDIDSDDDDDDDTAPEQYPETCETGPVLTFNLSVTPHVAPYPNDLYTVPDATSPTGRRVHIDGDTTDPIGQIAGMGLLSFVIDAVNQLNGFGPMAEIYLPVGVDSRPGSWPDVEEPGLDDAVFVMVDDPASPYHGEFAPVLIEKRLNALQLRPYKPLRENTHYVVVATRNLLPIGAEGECYQASETMRAIWDSFQHGAEAAFADRYHDSLDNLRDLGLAPGQILAIGDFTTMWATYGLNKARELLDELAVSDPPTFTNWQIQYSGSEGIYGYLIADMSLPILQNEDGQWEFDANGDVVLQDWTTTKVRLSLPRENAYPSGQPYPLTLWAHGVGDSNLSIIGLGSYFAQGGVAMAGISAACHGDRAPIPYDPITTMLCYFDVLHPLRARDNFRETVIDYMWLARALLMLDDFDQIPYPDGDGIPDFDVSQLYYTSVSISSIHGGALAALEENIDTYVFSSAGAKYMGIAIEGPYFGFLVDIARQLDNLNPGMHAEDFVWLVSHLAQHILEEGDPANFLPYTGGEPLPGLDGHAPQILQQGAAEDEVLGGLSGAYFCRAGGWPQLNPYVWDVGAPHADCPYEGSAFYQFDTSEHLPIYYNDVLGQAYRAQAIHYLRSDWETDVAEIIDPYAE